MYRLLEKKNLEYEFSCRIHSVLPSTTSEQVLFDEDFGADELPLFL